MPRSAFLVGSIAGTDAAEHHGGRFELFYVGTRTLFLGITSTASQWSSIKTSRQRREDFTAASAMLIYPTVSCHKLKTLALTRVRPVSRRCKLVIIQ